MNENILKKYAYPIYELKQDNDGFKSNYDGYSCFTLLDNGIKFTIKDGKFKLGGEYICVTFFEGVVNDVEIPYSFIEKIYGGKIDIETIMEIEQADRTEYYREKFDEDDEDSEEDEDDKYESLEKKINTLEEKIDRITRNKNKENVDSFIKKMYLG